MFEMMLIGVAVNWFLLGPFLAETSRAEKVIRAGLKRNTNP